MITIEPTPAGMQNRVENAITRSIEVIRRRVDPTGTTEATIQAQGGANGKDRILIQVPGLAPEEVKARVGTTAKLTFQLVDLSMSAEDAEANGVPPDDILLPDAEHQGRKVLLHKEVIVSGDDLTNAYAGYDNRCGRGWRTRRGFRVQQQGRRRLRAGDAGEHRQALRDRPR